MNVHIPATLVGHGGVVTHATFSPDGTLVLTTSADSTARLWDATTGQCLRILAGHADWVSGGCFHPDGDRLATWADGGTLRLWDTVSGDCLRQLPRAARWVTDAPFSPDGRLLLTASDDATVRLWQADGARTLADLPHPDDLSGWACTTDSTHLVTTCMDGGVRVWRLATGKLAHTLREDTDFFTL